MCWESGHLGDSQKHWENQVKHSLKVYLVHFPDLRSKPLTHDSNNNDLIKVGTHGPWVRYAISLSESLAQPGAVETRLHATWPTGGHNLGPKGHMNSSF